MPLPPLAETRLYAFVDHAYLRGRPPADIARQLCDGGADLIQLRAKDLPAEAVLRMAERLLPVTEPAGVWLVINDHPGVACAVGAPLCHLGQEDFFDAGYTHVDQIIRPLAAECGSAAGRGGGKHLAPFAVGLSSHAPEQAERAVRAGAAYVAIGPVYATPTKPGVRAVTLDYVRWAAKHLTLPWFAIGGVTLETLDAVLEAGARRVCVVSAILNSSDITRTCQAFKQRLKETAFVT